MIQAFYPDASASTSRRVYRRPTDAPNSALAPVPTPAPRSPESLRHMIYGSLGGVQAVIKHLHKLNYAEPNDWSKPMPSGCPNEVMVILTKRVR